MTKAICGSGLDRCPPFQIFRTLRLALPSLLLLFPFFFRPLAILLLLFLRPLAPLFVKLEPILLLHFCEKFHSFVFLGRFGSVPIHERITVDFLRSWQKTENAKALTMA